MQVFSFETDAHQVVEMLAESPLCRSPSANVFPEVQPGSPKQQTLDTTPRIVHCS